LQPNREPHAASVSGGIGAAAHSRSLWPRWSGWSSALAMRIAGEPSMLTIVAPVRLISGQKLLTEKRRSIAA